MTHQKTYNVRGKRGTLIDLCNYFKIVGHKRALDRLQDGWSPEESVCTPLCQKGSKKPKLQS